MVHQPDLWGEIQAIISDLDSEACLDMPLLQVAEVSKYKNVEIKRALRKSFRASGWKQKSRQTWTTSDEKVLRKVVGLGPKKQRELIRQHGLVPMMTGARIEYTKGSVGVDVQFGKAGFVAHSMFVKMADFHLSGLIGVGVVVLPMKAMKLQMSSPTAYYEREMANMIRNGQSLPAVPLVLVGVLP